MNAIRFRSLASAAFAVTALVTCPVDAAIVTFSGIDPGVGPTDPRPLSNAAAASFDAAAGLLGPSTLINFESAPVGGFTSLLVAPGVTLTQTGGASTIANAPVATPASLYGFNTTT